jgi:hypothetical protein
MNSDEPEEILKAITPAKNPDWRPTKEPVTLRNNKTATEILLEMRLEERF